MRKFLLILFFCCSAFASPHIYWQQNITPATHLGNGFETDNDLQRQACLNFRKYNISGSRVVDAKLQSTSLTDAYMQLYLNSGIGPTYAVFSNNPAHSFLQKLVNSADTQTFLYRTNVVLPSKGLGYSDEPTLNAQGRLSIDLPQTFRDLCGDQFISQLYYQGSLYIAIRLNFLNKQDKEKFKLDGDLTYKELLAQLPKALSKQNPHGAISVLVYQMGGELSPIQKIYTVNQCSFNKDVPCLEQLQNLYNYSDSFLQQFPSTSQKPIPKTAAINEYIARTYRALDIPYQPVADKLTREIKGLRIQLHIAYTKLWPLKERAHYILQLNNLNPSYRTDVEELLKKIDYNEKIYQSVGKACFIHLQDCENLYQNIETNLEPLQTDILNDPELE